MIKTQKWAEQKIKTYKKQRKKQKTQVHTLNGGNTTNHLESLGATDIHFKGLQHKHLGEKTDFGGHKQHMMSFTMQSQVADLVPSILYLNTI